MGNKISCVCDRSEFKQMEMDFSSNREEEKSSINDYSTDHVKSANKIQNKYRQMKNNEKLLIEVKESVKNRSGITIEEITIQDFESLINDNAKKILNDASILKSKSGKTSDFNKGNIQVRLPPIKEINSSAYTIYFGEWSIDGSKSGKGNQILPDGSIYSGDLENNKFHGTGVFISSNGDYYIGQWKEDKASGNGKLVTNSYTYFGSWEDNQKHGRGEEKYSDGSVYSGEFKNSERDGEGIYTWPDKTVYKGLFKSASPHGCGEIRWPDGRVYTGEMEEGKMHGKGTFTWPDGTSYSGFYHNDTKCGFGIYKWKDDKFYTGHWLNNKQHGSGSVHIGGKVFNGLWRYGKLIQCIEEEKTNLNQIDDNTGDKSQLSQALTFKNTEPVAANPNKQ